MLQLPKNTLQLLSDRDTAMCFISKATLFTQAEVEITARGLLKNIFEPMIQTLQRVEKQSLHKLL